jgi:very-short-patch-repair endonuclease
MSRDGPISLPDEAFSARRHWWAVAVLAARQHGVVALAQLVALGVAPPTVRGWVASGRLIRLYQGVFAVGHAALRREGHMVAAVLACGEGAVLSYASAGAHWGIRQSDAAAIDVTSPLRTGRTRGGLRVHRGDRLRADEATVVDAVPCTTVARTVLDLAVVLDAHGLSRAIEAAERRELLDLRPLRVLVGRHHGRRGVRRLRRALAIFDPDFLRVHSELEARCLQLCIDRRIPKPLVNRRIDVGEETFEVDFHWPEARLIVETDGRVYHDTVAARRRDANRDRALTAAGWTVIRCGWRDVVHNPAPLIARLRTLLGTLTPTG